LEGAASTERKAAPAMERRGREPDLSPTLRNEDDPLKTHSTDLDRLGSVTDLSVSELERIVFAASRPCVTDPEAWFPHEPDAGRRGARERYEARARALCRFCPVALACLELTIAREGKNRGSGIAGATAPWQRQAIKRARGVRTHA
jgi:Transcription factor WhiB